MLLYAEDILDICDQAMNIRMYGYKKGIAEYHYILKIFPNMSAYNTEPANIESHIRMHQRAMTADGN